MLIENREFRHETVNLDGNRFVNCHFIECRLVFSGFNGANLDRCTFTRCDWVLEGPAENTLEYLAAVYRGLGSQGQQIVESLFDSIRRGTVGQHTALPVLSGPFATQ